MVVAGHGFHVDLSRVSGELWDADTVRAITWGLRDSAGQRFGRVVLKNGTARARKAALAQMAEDAVDEARERMIAEEMSI
ncbi:MAG: hypothetical protein WAR76_22900 [Xanthobacteraceae bacterium]